MTAVCFHHVSLSVADLAAQEAWYGDAFGLTEAEERIEMPEAGVRTVVLSDGAGLRVEFVERSGSSPVAHGDPFAATSTQTFTHLALQVPDLGAVFARLTTECGAAAVSPPAPGATEGMRYAYVADPEGNLLELIETPQG
ncbi:VOC family protein [Streptomyces sp. SAI-149]|uniref:VOC family protein n=1 Tax=unclassified Streptomyces TaxID=2593676 RepID=UPI0024740203|nr:VOC family protein [Streptomyces sp. SAI-149]MDH6502550.1 catechol 2,3-dioxygenase-like lactoylglutathione lyase family enzyme [Streptomyces sp. SAI-149]